MSTKTPMTTKECLVEIFASFVSFAIILKDSVFFLLPVVQMR